MSGLMDLQIKRWALDASDWLWGTAQGAFNEKQTTSQIIVDAVIGMIPLVGDATAARDLIAVSTRLADDPKKREEVMEWMLLVVLLFALIPVVGGVIKGVGRLLLKVGKNAAEAAPVLHEIVSFLNRIGHGNAVQWIKALDLMPYQGQITTKFGALMDQLVAALHAILNRAGLLMSASMRSSAQAWITKFGQLKALGSKMIPQALKALNDRLKLVQRAVYQAEWHTVTTGTKNITREAEARLVERAPRALPRTRKGFPNNTLADYHHVEGWPDLRNGAKFDDSLRMYRCETIEAFSGAMRAVELKPGQTLFRVLNPNKNYKASPWWTMKMPETAEEWRELLAVLDKFNINGFFVKYTIPEGTTLKAWAGKAAEQFDKGAGQYLGGGGEQLFVEFPSHIKAEIMKLPALSTGWGKTLRLFGFGKQSDAAIGEIQIERLAANEVQSKKVAGH